MLTMNKNLYPKDGYFFKDSDGARIYGDSWKGVIARVAAYRKRAGYPPGNPAVEVIAQACQRQPGYCTETRGGNAVYEAQLSRSTLKSRVLKWLTARRQDPPESRMFVSDEVRRNRATVCASCVHNHSISNGCGSCKAAVRELRLAILGKRPVDGRLNACAGTSEDLGVSSNIEQVAVDNPGLPDNCWRKKTI